MEEGRPWNVELVERHREVKDCLRAIYTSDLRNARLCARKAEAAIDQATQVLASLSPMVRVDELAGLPDADLLRILSGALQAIQGKKRRPTRRALLAVLYQALAENRDLAQKIEGLFPVTILEESRGG